MSRRSAVVISVLVGVVAIAFGMAYLTGAIILGDPFTGVWNARGTWARAGDSGAVIRRTSNGYVYTTITGVKPSEGWQPLQREGRRLVGEGNGGQTVFEYQPWTGHLVFIRREHGILIVRGMTLKRVTSSTQIPPASD